jgi:signal peptidase II
MLTRTKLGGWTIPAVAAIVLVLDQMSKAWVLRTLPENAVWVPIPALSRFLTITHVTNTGAAFGLFKDRGVLFILIAIAVSAGIVIYSRYLPQGRFWVRFSLGLQLGGAIGNLIDRVRFGHVTDFITVGIDDLKWPTFNVADSAIVVGVIILAFIVFTEKESSHGDVTDIQKA